MAERSNQIVLGEELIDCSVGHGRVKYAVTVPDAQKGEVDCKVH